jgi:hypothetical protein
VLIRTFWLWSADCDVEAQARQGTATYPPSSSSVTSRTRPGFLSLLVKTTASFFFRSLICHLAEMSTTSEANKKLIGDAFANMVRRTRTVGAASFLERLCTLTFYII